MNRCNSVRDSGPRSILMAAAALASASLASQVLAADRVWVAEGDKVSWSDVKNWDNATLPNDGDNLIFPDLGGSFTIDTNANRSVGTLLFDSSSAYTFNNNALKLGGGNFISNGQGDVTLNSDLATGGTPQSFQASGGGLISLNGVISDGGAFTFDKGRYVLSNANSTFTGGVNVNSSVEGRGNATTLNVLMTTGANTQFGNGGGGGAIVINGGTLKLTPVQVGTTAGGLFLGRAVTFGANGGTLDLTNTVGGNTGPQATLNGITLNAGTGSIPIIFAPGGAGVIKWNGGQGGLSTNSTTNGDLRIGDNALRIASISGASATTPLLIEITNGALMDFSGVFSTPAPITVRGVAGGNSSGSGLKHNVGRMQASAGPYVMPGGITFEDAFQLSNANGVRIIDGNVTIAGTTSGHPGEVAFSGRGTGTAVSTTHNNELRIGNFGAGTNRTLLLQSGGQLALDNRIRTDQPYMHGVQVNAQTIMEAGSTLHLRTSFVRTNEATNVSYVEILGPLTARGTTAQETVIDVTLPVRGSGDQPTNFGGYTFGSGTATANLIINGQGLGGLQVIGRAHVGKSYSGTNPTNEDSLPVFVDGFTNVQRVMGAGGLFTDRAIASPQRLAAIKGTGGYLTLAAQNETLPFPAVAEWDPAVPVGLRIANSNPGGDDVSLPPGSWSHNLHLDSGASVYAPGVTMNAGTLSGNGRVNAQPVGFRVGAPAVVAPGFGTDTGVISFDTITVMEPASTNIKIKGQNAGTGHDQVNVAGALLLGGKLAIARAPAFIPQAYTPIVPLTFSSLTNKFSLITGMDAGVNNGHSMLFAPIYSTNDLRLIPALPGDATLDKMVDFNDLVPLAQHYGTSDGSAGWPTGDFTGDGNVDFNDLVALAQNYGQVFAAPAVPGASVPEPSALGILAVGAAMTLRRRRRR